MSQENVEIIRKTLEAFNSSDFDLDSWIDEFFDSEIEWHDLPIAPDAGVYSGRDAFRRRVAAYRETWAEPRIDSEDMTVIGNRVVVRGRYGGIGKASGTPMTGDMSLPATWGVYDFRAGRILRVQQFMTHAEALEAVGLSEQDANADS